jgi:hypothetical protein
MKEILEAQRYGRDKETLVNSNYISSGQYRQKFDKIVNDKKFSRTLYDKAKEMLLHRSGTLYEDMYWFDADTGGIIASEVNSSEEEQILYSNKINKAIENHDNIITMHTQIEALNELTKNYEIEFWEVL